MVGVLRGDGRGARVTPDRVLASTPVMVGLINAAVAGVLAALVAGALGGPTTVAVAAGVAAGLTYAAVLASIPLREIARMQREWRPCFPTPPSEGP